MNGMSLASNSLPAGWVIGQLGCLYYMTQMLQVKVEGWDEARVKTQTAQVYITKVASVSYKLWNLQWLPDVVITS
jgi:hypothetical protein